MVGDQTQGSLATAGDEQRDAVLLHRPGMQLHLLKLTVSALEKTDRFAVHLPRDDLQRLGQGRLALADRRERQTHGAKLKLHVAGSEPDGDPPL